MNHRSITSETIIEKCESLIYTVTVFTSYWRFFYVQDENIGEDLSASWNKRAEFDGLAVEYGSFGVPTLHQRVNVRVKVLHSQPLENFEMWDHVTECGIEIPSGKIVVAGAIESFPHAARMLVPPDTYRARIYYGNLYPLTKDALEDSDFYEVALWPSQRKEVTVIKRRPDLHLVNNSTHLRTVNIADFVGLFMKLKSGG